MQEFTLERIEDAGHSVAIYTRAPMINSIVIDFNNEDAFLMQDIVDRVT